jgi:hypothetical protein
MESGTMKVFNVEVFENNEGNITILQASEYTPELVIISKIQLPLMIEMLSDLYESIDEEES